MIMESYKGYGYKMPRTQAEAGLEYHTWEDRVKIRMPYLRIAGLSVMSGLILWAFIEAVKTCFDV